MSVLQIAFEFCWSTFMRFMSLEVDFGTFKIQLWGFLLGFITVGIVVAVIRRLLE